MNENNKKSSLTSKVRAIKQRFTERRGTEATVATIITVMFVVAVVLVNMIASVIGDKVSLNIDLTNNRAYSLTSDTINYIGSLEKEVSIDVLNTEEAFSSGSSEIAGSSKFFAQTSNLINQYVLHSDKISVNYIDTVKSPNYIAQYPDEKLYYNDVIIKCNGRHKVISSYDLFNIGSSGSSSSSSYTKQSYSIKSSNAEQVITSAILTLSSDITTKVTFLTGYEEDDSTPLQNLLKENNYEVKIADILSGSIDTDTKILFLFGPKRDYDDLGLSKLRDFMNNAQNGGVSIFYAANPESGELPGVNVFLKEYGMSVGNGKVYSTEKQKYIPVYNGGQYYYSQFYAQNEYAESKFNENMTSNRPVIVPGSKPIEIIDGELAKPIITMGQGGIATSPEGGIDENAASTPNIPVAAIAEKSSAANPEIKNSVVTVGSDEALGEYELSATSTNNTAYFLNMFSSLSGVENNVVIAPKSLTSGELGITMMQAYVIGIVMMLLIPVIILIFGICIWARRRHR